MSPGFSYINNSLLEQFQKRTSKASDCIPHDLIIAKLEAYGFHIDALKLIHNYFSKRKQRVKVNDGRIYFMASHRDPYSVLYYSIYIYVTYSIF